MGLMGYDAFNLGENELRYSPDFLKQLQQYGLTYVSANLLLNGQQPDFVKPYVVKDVNGTKVAITGVIDRAILDSFKTNEDPVDAGYTASDYVQTLSTLVPELKKQADVVIVLAHVLPADATALASKVPAIDLIVGSHNGVLLDPPTEVGKTVVGEASRKGKYLGDITFGLDDSSKTTIHAGKPILLDPSHADDPDIANLMKDYKSRLQNPPTPTPTATGTAGS